MADLIDRGALIDEWKKSIEYAKAHGDSDMEFFFGACIHQVQTCAPTITPESLVRHGRWIKEWSDIFGLEIERCSECQAMHDRNQSWDAPYCPLCGAKMDLEE